MDDTHLDSAFSALGDSTRRSILQRLKDGEATVTQLAEPYDMSLNAVSKHIKMLEKAGLIEREIKGRTHYIKLRTQPMQSLSDWLKGYMPETSQPQATEKAEGSVSVKRKIPIQPKPAPAPEPQKPQKPGGLMDRIASRLKLGGN